MSISLSRSRPNTSGSSSSIPSSPLWKRDGEAAISSGSSPTSLTLSVVVCRHSKLDSSSSEAELTQCGSGMPPSHAVENERFCENRNGSLCDSSISYAHNISYIYTYTHTNLQQRRRYCTDSKICCLAADLHCSTSRLSLSGDTICDYKHVANSSGLICCKNY